MNGWISRNSSPIQAAAAILTAVVALCALIGVKIQIDASERTQREQSARDIYREYLALSINKPEFADPDVCGLLESPQAAAYENYVDYLLYTAEQVLSVSPAWDANLLEHMAAHRDYLCAPRDWSGESAEVIDLIGRFKNERCQGFTAKCLPKT